ncbi:hypothetical protein MTR67_034976 [Solanum verrucosum]|uniref:Reverse transcriptase/retrotransposon-derived protein RNase H-like domain-containing protein n=1 Tax=Solanum verrucosum TaxID=315347 RepID=A0AAF0U9J8_SOLVR|nr:hypothetical protein MTR67_034976 [Solanum verrucosum]
MSHRVTLVDLVELDMLDFDVILSMDWLHSSYISIDCRIRVVKFQFPNMTVLKWKGENSMPKGSIAFLSHIVSSKGIEVDPKKTDAVNSFPRPISPSDIISFLSLASYYRRFVEKFSSIASPLTPLTQKKAKFIWFEPSDKSFQELKDRLTSALVLTLQQGTDGFVIYYDASRIGLRVYLCKMERLLPMLQGNLRSNDKIGSFCSRQGFLFGGRLCLVVFEANGLGTRVKLSTDFHRQTDGQTERTIQTLENMLRARCRSPIGWFEVGEVALIGPEFVHDVVNHVRLIRERLKIAKSQQKSYVDVRRRDLEFNAHDWFYIKISPMKGVMRFFFHVSLLKKCVGDPTSTVPIDSLGIKENLSYEEVLVEILDRQIKKFKNKEVVSVKVLWRNQLLEELRHPSRSPSWAEKGTMTRGGAHEFLEWQPPSTIPEMAREGHTAHGVGREVRRGFLGKLLALRYGSFINGFLPFTEFPNSAIFKAKEQGKDIIGQKGANKLKKSKAGTCQSHLANHQVNFQLTKSYNRPAHGQDQLGERFDCSATCQMERRFRLGLPRVIEEK